jgi:hypothetical protein
MAGADAASHRAEKHESTTSSTKGTVRFPLGNREDAQKSVFDEFRFGTDYAFTQVPEPG